MILSGQADDQSSTAGHQNATDSRNFTHHLLPVLHFWSWFYSVDTDHPPRAFVKPSQILFSQGFTAPCQQLPLNHLDFQETWNKQSTPSPTFRHLMAPRQQVHEVWLPLAEDNVPSPHVHQLLKNLLRFFQIVHLCHFLGIPDYHKTKTQPPIHCIPALQHGEGWWAGRVT